MSTAQTLTRRHFLKATGIAAATAPFLLPSSVWSAAKGPNDKITLGFIGMGTQNRGLLGGFLNAPDTQVLAVCDVDTTRREHSRKTVNDHYAKQGSKGSYLACSGYEDFRDLLARKDIDAVVIATPDHWHAYIAILAANSGKDIYCEKPLSLTIHEARAMVRAVRKHKRIFQTGSMQRSMSDFYKGCMVARNGLIGNIKEVYVSVGGPSRWCDLPEEPVEPGLNWDFWLGPAPVRPYNSVLSPRGVHKHFPNWREYREYSGGGMTDWGAHHFDIAQWGLGMDNSGPVEIHPPDGKDFKRLTYKYSNRTLMYHGGLEGYPFGVVFVGTAGKVCVDRGKHKFEPESLEQTRYDQLPVRLYKSDNHLTDWLKSIRSRQLPICDVEIGARSVTVCHLGNLAYWNKCALRWDPVKEKFVRGAGDNKWLDREKRAPWKV
jgi:predicted dehydrogenase